MMETKEISFYIDGKVDKVTGKVIKETEYGSYIAEVETDLGEVKKYELEPEYLELCELVGKEAGEGYHRLNEALPRLGEAVIVLYGEDFVGIHSLHVRAYSRGRRFDNLYTLEFNWNQWLPKLESAKKWHKIPEDDEKEE